MSRGRLGEQLRSPVWGNAPATVSQEFGVYNAQLASWYQYAADVGWPAGTHVGIDVAMPQGTPIYASESGTVIQAGWSDSFRPSPVWIREDDGDTAIYGHMWEATVRAGQRVRAGQMVGRSGQQTRRGTWIPDGSGEHLHYELRSPQGVAIDPVPELTGSAGLGTRAPTDGGSDYQLGNEQTLGMLPDRASIERGAMRVVAVAVGLVLLLGAALLLRGRLLRGVRG